MQLYGSGHNGIKSGKMNIILGNESLARIKLIDHVFPVKMENGDHIESIP